MPTLLARGCAPELAARVKNYARDQELSVSDAVAALLTIALDHQEARSSGGSARWQGTTTADRSQAAIAAVQARWAKAKPPAPSRTRI